jgi:hypothetical protein
MSDQNVHPEIAEHEWIDDAFRVYKTKYNLWHSAAKDGEELITALTEQQCIDGTRFYLKGRQEGWVGVESTQHEGTVGGKL